MKRNLIAKLVLACFLIIACSYVFSGDASAMLINYIGSDGLDPSLVPVDLNFSVAGSDLTATLTNDSAFTITALFFNASQDVSALTLNAAPSGWNLVTDTKAGPWSFDYGISAHLKSGIAPYSSGNFLLSISGTGSYNASDFWVGNSPTAAAKGQAGPGGASGFVAAPEPATLLLLGFGLAGLGLYGRKRRMPPTNI